MTSETIIVEQRRTALWITLNRPGTLNSINGTLVRELRTAIDLAEQRPELRSMVITGAGRAFCAGGDLKELDNGVGGHRSGEALHSAISETLARLEAIAIPVIAAVNGIAIAGGLEIALACDIVVAVRGAQFGDGHARYGLLPGGGGSVRLPRKIGVNRAKHLMLTGHLVSAEIMQSWGLVTEVAEDDGLVDAVDHITASLAQKSLLGLARMKRLIDDGMAHPLDAALANEQAVCSLHDASFDRNEGLAAFAAKRTPQFRGA